MSSPRVVPNPRLNPDRPWSLSELELILASARTIPSKIDGIPASSWWSAFILVVLDTAERPSNLLTLPRTAYHVSTGQLTIGPRRYELHLLSTEALGIMLPHSKPELFPWPLDPRPDDLHALSDQYREILYRANLPAVPVNLFPRLVFTARKTPDILKQLRLDVPLQPRQGRSVENLGTSWSASGRLTPEDATEDSIDRPLIDWHEPEMIRRGTDISQTLRHFFETTYRRLRLADVQDQSIFDYRTMLDALHRFQGRPARFEHLSDAWTEEFLVWLKQQGKANATINRYRALLLALWRYAWRKRLVDDLPRDVQKYRVPKRIPEAWTVEELSKIIKTAATTPGEVRGVPKADWWVALILLLYDTGLRIGAATKIEKSNFDAESQTVTVPAAIQKQNADQVFDLHQDTVAALERLRPSYRPDQRWLIPPRTKKYMIENYRAILRNAGLPCGPRDLFHRIRRTSGTAVAQAADLQSAKEHLGHSSVDLTKRHYIDPRKLDKRSRAADLIKRPTWDREAETDRGAGDHEER